jgi:hypothetical protein
MGPNIREQAAQWATPSAQISNDGESPETWHARAAKLKEKHGNGNGAGLPLTVAAVQWPTPNVCSPNSMRGKPQDPAKRRAAGHQVNLQDVAGYWANPNAHSSHLAMQTKKATQVLVRCSCGRLSIFPVCTYLTAPCPACKGFDGAVTFLYSRQDHPTQDGPQSCETTPNSPRRLNPLFGEQLMGWRFQWTKAEPSASSASETALWRSRLQQHLSCLLGEQGLE